MTMNNAPSPQPETVSEMLEHFLFIAMDDDGNAHPQNCVCLNDVYECVKKAIFDDYPVEGLSGDDRAMVAGLVDELLADGTVRFEGDAPLHLFRLAAAPTASTLLTDDKVIELASRAGMKWIPPDDGKDDALSWPGGFDFCDIEDVRRLLAATPPPAAEAQGTDQMMRRLTGLWRFGRDVLPNAAIDFSGWLFQLDALIDSKTQPPSVGSEGEGR